MARIFANINTIGYKSVDTQFSTMVGDGVGAGSYAAGGVSVAPRALISKAGQLNPSTSSTDLGIEGQGFFVVRSGTAADSTVMLTRAGSFAPDKTGFLRNTAGLYLQGWRLDATGGYTNTGSVASMEPVRVSDLAGTAAASTKFQISANFSRSQPVNAAVTAGTYAAGQMAGGTVTPDFSRSVDVFDQQGGTHRLSMNVIKSGAREWKVEIVAPDATHENGGAVANGLLRSGTIKFNADGSLDKAGSTPATLFDPVKPTWNTGAGAEPIALSFGSDKGKDGLTEFEGESSERSKAVDGGLLGNISSVDVSKSGLVSAVFENGTKRAVFQLPIATVPNPDGLNRVNGNAFTLSEKSGAYAINTAGSLGAGTISGFKLEASTADLAQEFTNMIRFQRAYSASSKIITTVDDMLQEVGNLKR